MILRDQYFLICVKSLQTFLKDEPEKHVSEKHHNSHQATIIIISNPSNNHKHKDKQNGPNKPYSKGSGTQETLRAI